MLALSARLGCSSCCCRLMEYLHLITCAQRNCCLVAFKWNSSLVHARLRKGPLASQKVKLYRQNVPSSTWGAASIAHRPLAREDREERELLLRHAFHESPVRTTYTYLFHFLFSVAFFNYSILSTPTNSGRPLSTLQGPVLLRKTHRKALVPARRGFGIRGRSSSRRVLNGVAQDPQLAGHFWKGVIALRRLPWATTRPIEPPRFFYI